MSLPSGYKQLEYIQSSGTQKIDTGLLVEESDSFEMEFEWTPTAPSSGIYVGADGYMQVGIGTSGYGLFLTSNTTAYGTRDKVRVVFASVTETLYVNNTQVFSHDWSKENLSNVKLGLFSCGAAGNTWRSGAVTAKLYGCTIKKAGVLVRNFIPCKNASGVIGLWDDVNSAFYQNAGSGAFTSGPEVKGTNKTLIGGTGYALKGGKPLIGGTAYAVKKGRALIGGTGYDISLLSGTPISELPVGNTVKIAVNGTLRDFLIVHQGLPSSMYDDSCNGTWLLMKEIYTRVQWAPSYAYNYSTSTINNYLNSDFLNLLDSSIKDVIQQVKIPYYTTNGGLPDIQYGANGVSCKIFLLSGYEVGWSYDVSMQFPEDGAKLSYFESGTSTSANNKRVATDGKTGWQSTKTWGLRSDYTANLDKVWYVESDGTYDRLEKNNSPGCRPALVLLADTPVSDDGTITT